MIRFCAMVLAAFFTLGLTGFAQDKKGPLAELPSKPGPHIEKIKAMGDNQWLNLGVPAADPKWGKARGSAWGAKALILHSRADDVIPFADSEELAKNSGATLIEVGSDHRFSIDRLTKSARHFVQSGPRCCKTFHDPHLPGWPLRSAGRPIGRSGSRPGHRRVAATLKARANKSSSGGSGALIRTLAGRERVAGFTAASVVGQFLSGCPGVRPPPIVRGIFVDGGNFSGEDFRRAGAAPC